MANIKRIDFFQLNVQKNSCSAKAKACRNSDFWDRAGIYCPSLHADDPEAMFRGKTALPLPVNQLFADSQSPLITLPHFYLPVMAARGEAWSIQDTRPLGKSRDLPSGFGRSSHTEATPQGLREDEKGVGGGCTQSYVLSQLQVFIIPMQTFFQLGTVLCHEKNQFSNIPFLQKRILSDCLAYRADQFQILLFSHPGLCAMKAESVGTGESNGVEVYLPANWTDCLLLQMVGHGL